MRFPVKNRNDKRLIHENKNTRRYDKKGVGSKRTIILWWFMEGTCLTVEDKDEDDDLLIIIGPYF